jgi:hypothetical protein
VDRVAVDAKLDHAARAVDLVDRVRGDETPTTREKARLDRERIRNVRSGAVHGALDLPDEPSLPVGHDVAGGATEIDGNGAHLCRTLCPHCKVFRRDAVKGLLTAPGILPLRFDG